MNKLKDFKEINYESIEFSSINADKKSLQKIIYEFFNKSESSINPPSLWVDRVFSIEGIGKVITGTASKNMSFDKVFVDDHQSQLDIRESRVSRSKIEFFNYLVFKNCNIFKK